MMTPILLNATREIYATRYSSNYAITIKREEPVTIINGTTKKIKRKGKILGGKLISLSSLNDEIRVNGDTIEEVVTNAGRVLDVMYPLETVTLDDYYVIQPELFLPSVLEFKEWFLLFNNINVHWIHLNPTEAYDRYTMESVHTGKENWSFIMHIPERDKFIYILKYGNIIPIKHMFRDPTNFLDNDTK